MSNNPFPMMEGAQYMSLTTYRQNGTPVATPVWFAQDGERIFAFSLANSGKVKRLRHTSKVEIAPCDGRGKLLGDKITTQARLHPADSPVAKHANQLLNKKYGLLKRILDLFYRLRSTSRYFIEIQA
jgi:uncharacterized protein